MTRTRHQTVRRQRSAVWQASRGARTPLPHWATSKHVWTQEHSGVGVDVSSSRKTPTTTDMDPDAFDEPWHYEARDATRGWHDEAAKFLREQFEKERPLVPEIDKELLSMRDDPTVDEWGLPVPELESTLYDKDGRTITSIHVNPASEMSAESLAKAIRAVRDSYARGGF